jgi:hypothetical protein
VATDGTDQVYGFDGSALASGEATMPRWAATASTTMSTGALRLTFFTATKTETVNNVRIVTTGTAAGATPSLIRVGLYSVDSSGNLTLVASTANDTTLLAATNTQYGKALSAGYAKVAGQRYALGLLVVTAAAAPTVLGNTMAGSGSEFGSGALPRLTGFISAQSDLPATITGASITDSTGFLYAVVKP